MLVVRIKAMCKKAGISNLDAGPKGATIKFHNDKFSNPAGLMEFITDRKGHAKVKDNKIVVMDDWTREKDKIQGAFALARDLATKRGTVKPKAADAGDTSGGSAKAKGKTRAEG